MGDKGILIAPTEPRALKAIGTTSSLPERFGVDVMWLVAREGQRTVRWGAQRKEWKDLIASVEDGRLAREIQQMRGVGLEGAFLVVEGWPKVVGGTLADKRFGRTWTVSQLRAVLWSTARQGIIVDRTVDVGDTVEWVKKAVEWTRKDKHSTVNSRPGPTGSMWGWKGNRDWGMHVLQGFQGVGPELAGRIWDEFGGVPLSWDVGVEELCRVKGMGKKKAERLYDALTRVDVEERDHE